MDGVDRTGDDGAAETPARRGRPRAVGLDDAIRRASWQVLSQAGYDGLTFEAVAEAAGCSRPTLYRRFANKSELILHLITARVDEIEAKLNLSSDPRLMLMEHLGGMARFLNAAGCELTLGTAQARRRDPRLDEAAAALYRENSLDYVRALQTASGGAAPQAFCRLLTDTLVGTLMFRIAMSNRQITDAEIAELVDQAIRSARAGPGPDWTAAQSASS